MIYTHVIRKNPSEIRSPLDGLCKMNDVRETIYLNSKTRKYSLAIADGREKILDYVYFEVRGVEEEGEKPK
jgi:hypothetical protein